MEIIAMGKNARVHVVDKLPVSDMIKAIAALDPLRKIPEAKKLLDMSLEEYDQHMASLETAEGE